MRKLAILLCSIAVNFLYAKDITVLSNDSATVAQKTIKFTPNLKPSKSGDKLLIYSSDTTIVRFEKNPLEVETDVEVTGKIVDFGLASITIQDLNSNKLKRSFKVSVLHTWEDGHNKIAHADIKEPNGQFQFIEDSDNLKSLLISLRAHNLQKETKAISLDWVIQPENASQSPEEVAQIIRIQEDSVKIFLKHPGNHKVLLRAFNGQKMDTITEFAYTMIGENHSNKEYFISKDQFGISLENGMIADKIDEDGIAWFVGGDDPSGYTHMLDQRDGHKYKVKTIAGKIWFAENLKYIPEGTDLFDELGSYGVSENIESTATLNQIKQHDDFKKYGVWYKPEALFSSSYFYETAEDDAERELYANIALQSLCPNGFRMINIADVVELLQSQGLTNPETGYYSSSDDHLAQSSSNIYDKLALGGDSGFDWELTGFNKSAGSTYTSLLLAPLKSASVAMVFFYTANTPSLYTYHAAGVTNLFTTRCIKE